MKRLILLPVLLSVTLMTACGGRSEGTVSNYTTDGGWDRSVSSAAMAENAALTDDMSAGSADSWYSEEEGNAGSGLEKVPSERKLIRTVNISLSIPSSDTLQENVSNLVSAVSANGGYVSSNNSEYGDYASASLTAMLPKDKADAFIAAVKDSGMRMKNISDSSSDVTLEYVDVASRLRVKQETRDKYETYLKDSTSIEDTMRIEEQLLAVTEDIESYQSRLNTLNSQIDYTTVTIYISCETSAEKTSFGFKLSEALQELVDEAGETFIDMLSWFVNALVSLVFILPVAVLVIRVFLFAIGKKVKGKNLLGRLRRKKMAATEETKTTAETPEKDDAAACREAESE